MSEVKICKGAIERRAFVAYSMSAVIETLEEQDSTEELFLFQVRKGPALSWLQVLLAFSVPQEFTV